MHIYDILEKKKRNQPVNAKEIKFMVEGFTQGMIADYQMSAFLMAICIQGMTNEETANLTNAMVQSGEIVDLSSIQGITVDKHSTGGVGDSTTLIISPIVAACGVPVAKMSGRGLGHTGGTIDKLESIVGLRTDISTKDFIKQVNDIAIALVGQTNNLVPADEKIYALRDKTATVDSIPLIAASIMSKKIASGADKILLDVKVGQGAFMKNLADAQNLARQMVAIGKAAGKETVAILSQMDSPLGKAIGNNLEVIEAIEVLRGHGPLDLQELSITLASYMLLLANQGDLASCEKMVAEVIENGAAFHKFKEMVTAQGGDSSYVDNISLFPKAAYTHHIISSTSGYIQRMDAEKLGKGASHLGAGRMNSKEQINMNAGIYCHFKPGDLVSAGDILLTLHTDKEETLFQVAKELEKVIVIAKNPPTIKPLVLDIII